MKWYPFWSGKHPYRQFIILLKILMKDDNECLSLKLAHLPETRMVTYVDENPEENIIQKEKEINDNIKNRLWQQQYSNLFYYPDDARHIIMDLAAKEKRHCRKLDIAVNTWNKDYSFTVWHTKAQENNKSNLA